MHDPGLLSRVLVVFDGDDAARRELMEAIALLGVPLGDQAETHDALVYRITSEGTAPLRALLDAHRPAAVVLLDAPDRLLLAELAAMPVQAVLLAPYTAAQAAVALEVAIARHRERLQMVGEQERLQQSLSNRKLIERAKGELMKRYRWTEPDAFRRLQRAAMNQRVSMADLARQILDGRDVTL